MADSRFSPEPLPPGTRIACRLEYDGRRFNGWQSQPHEGVLTVQDCLERAMAEVAGCHVRVHCAGRTDTGVHGFCQIVHFDPGVSRSPKAWVMGVNANLPPDIRVHWALPVSNDFHARFSAVARRYRYLVANTAIRPALMAEQVAWYRRPLEASAMHAAGQFLLGERDFSAFRAASCQSASPMRNVQSLQVARRGELVIIDIAANAFLHHMVRNIAGSLLMVGDGRRSPGWISELLEGADRAVAADTAPARGLYLVDVIYPEEFGLPDTPFGPPLLGQEV